MLIQEKVIEYNENQTKENAFSIEKFFKNKVARIDNEKKYGITQDTDCLL